MGFEEFAGKALKTAGWIGAGVASAVLDRVGENAVRMSREAGTTDTLSEKSFEFSEKLKDASRNLKGQLDEEKAREAEWNDDE